MKKDINLLIGAMLISIATHVMATESHGVTLDQHCLISDDKKVQLEWGTVSVGSPDWEASYIKYGVKKKPINIYLQSIKAEDDGPVDRPKVFMRQYLEIIDGKISGEYVFNTQGVNFVDGYYKSYKTGKITNLSGGDIFSDGCVWKR
jgi:hypothetical protein